MSAGDSPAAGTEDVLLPPDLLPAHRGLPGGDGGEVRLDHTKLPSSISLLTVCLARCVSLPSLQPGDVQAEQCTVALGENTCQQVG